MQWCAGGSGARRAVGLLRGAEGLPWTRLRQVDGRTDAMALTCSALARADERGADLLERLADGPVTIELAERCRAYRWSDRSAAPLPADFTRSTIHARPCAGPTTR